MPCLRKIALCALPYPESASISLVNVLRAIQDAAETGACLVCFPECAVPGYPVPKTIREPVSAEWLEEAHRQIACAAGQARIGVIVGTERIADGERRLCALVASSQGVISGYQDKVQLDPSEVQGYFPGSGRKVFEEQGICFGISICHEGFRYPETVRECVRAGAHIVFHPHYSWLETKPEDCPYPMDGYAHPNNSFHEASALCRAAENTCYYATVNGAEAASPTTTALIYPDGKLQSFIPRGYGGNLAAEIDLELSTGLYAHRLRS